MDLGSPRSLAPLLGRSGQLLDLQFRGPGRGVLLHSDPPQPQRCSPARRAVEGFRRALAQECILSDDQNPHRTPRNLPPWFQNGFYTRVYTPSESLPRLSIKGLVRQT